MFKKIKFYKGLLFEIIETLRSICLYLDNQGRRTYNENARYMRGHFNELGKYACELEQDINKKKENIKNNQLKF